MRIYIRVVVDDGPEDSKTRVERDLAIHVTPDAEPADGLGQMTTSLLDALIAEHLDLVE